MENSAYRQRGFSLPEVLVATAIAAGVLAAAAESISGSTRLSARAVSIARDDHAASTIVARLRAGLPDEESLEGFEGWTIEREALTTPPGEPMPYDHVLVARGTFLVELLLPTTDVQ